MFKLNVSPFSKLFNLTKLKLNTYLAEGILKDDSDAEKLIKLLDA